MELGVHISTFPGGARALAATAQAAEQGGASTVTLMDHWFQMEVLGGPAEPMLEGYTALGFLAAQTSRVRLGLLVTGVTYRHPGLLAKIVTTLDVLSAGRAMFGIGAAWYEREHDALGVPYPPVAERFERLEEAVQIVLQMWGPNDGPYAGKHYQLAETRCVPPPVQNPPPILIGGGGERKTLRLVAQYAQACNLFGSPDQVAHKLRVLDAHCADVGRDPAQIERTVLAAGDPVTDPEGFLADAVAFADLGVATVMITPQGNDPAGYVAEATANLVPALREL